LAFVNLHCPGCNAGTQAGFAGSHKVCAGLPVLPKLGNLGPD